MLGECMDISCSRGIRFGLELNVRGGGSGFGLDVSLFGFLRGVWGMRKAGDRGEESVHNVSQNLKFQRWSWCVWYSDYSYSLIQSIMDFANLK